MKNLLWTLTIIIILSVLVWYLLPVFLAKSITSDKSLGIIPEEIKEEVSGLPEKLEAADLTEKEMIDLVDQVSNREMLNIYEELKATALTDVDQVAHIILKDLQLTDDKKLSLVTLLKQNITLEEIKATMKELSKNEEMLQFYFPVIKETIKRVLEQKGNEAEVIKSE